MNRRFYLSQDKLPELAAVPDAMRAEVLETALRRAWRHWQVLLAYAVWIVGTILMPRYDIPLGRFHLNVTGDAYLLFGAFASQAIRLHFARRYIE